jgi:HEAT repeat protein
VASSAFERFRFSFFEDPKSAQDGLDTRSLAELEGEERARAEDMLINYLPDTRGVIGLGVLRSRRAEPLLVPLFEEERCERGSGLTDLARALWRIRPDPRWRSALIEVLGSAEFHIQRMHAAIALRDVHDPVVVPPVIAALDDPESLVRYHAAYTLLALHGLLVDALNPPEMVYRAMADDPARRAGGKSDVLAAIAGRAIAP